MVIKNFKHIYFKKKNNFEKLEKKFVNKMNIKENKKINLTEDKEKLLDKELEEEEKLKDDFIEHNLFKIKDIEIEKLKDLNYCNSIHDIIYTSINDYNIYIDEYSHIKVWWIILDSSKFLNLDLINEFLKNFELNLNNSQINNNDLNMFLEEEYNNLRNLIDKLNIHILKIYKLKNKCKGILKDILNIKIKSQIELGIVLFEILSIITLIINLNQEFLSISNKIDLTLPNYNNLFFLKYLYMLNYKIENYETKLKINKKELLNLNFESIENLIIKLKGLLNLNTDLSKKFYKIPSEINNFRLDLNKNLYKIGDNLKLENPEEKIIIELSNDYLKILNIFKNYLQKINDEKIEYLKLVECFDVNINFIWIEELLNDLKTNGFIIKTIIDYFEKKIDLKNLNEIKSKINLDKNNFLIEILELIK